MSIQNRMSMMPDDLVIIINQFIGLPFKDELLNHSFRRYFTFYLTPDSHNYYNKKWGPDNYQFRKTVLLTPDISGRKCRGLGVVSGEPIFKYKYSGPGGCIEEQIENTRDFES